jgi:hypothetical protein
MAIADLSKLQKLKDLKAKPEVVTEVSENAANMALLTSFGSYTESVIAPKSADTEDDLFGGPVENNIVNNDTINSLEDDIFGGKPVPETISQLATIEQIDAAKEDSIDKIIQSLQSTNSTSTEAKPKEVLDEKQGPKSDPIIKSYSLSEPDTAVQQVTKARKKVKPSKTNKAVYLQVAELEASLFLISNYLTKK